MIIITNDVAECSNEDHDRDSIILNEEDELFCLECRDERDQAEYDATK